MKKTIKQILLFTLVLITPFYGVAQREGYYLSPTSSVDPIASTEAEALLKKLKEHSKREQIMFLWDYFTEQTPDEYEKAVRSKLEIIMQELLNHFKEDIRNPVIEEKWDLAWEQAMERLREDFGPETSVKSYLSKNPITEKKTSYIDKKKRIFHKLGLAYSEKEGVFQMFREMEIAEKFNQKFKGTLFQRQAEAFTNLYDINHLSLYQSKQESFSLIQSSNLIEGETLRDYVKKHGPQSIPDTFKVVKQLLQIAIFLRETQLLHQDISHKNVMINEQLKVKLIDFGQAFFYPDYENYLSINPGYVGTPSFVSPAVVAGKKRMFQDDLWPIGMLFYYLLIGEFPFNVDQAKNVKEVYQNILEYNPPFNVPPNHPNQLFVEVAHIINTMLTPLPEYQYQTAENVLWAIRDIETRYFYFIPPIPEQIATSL